MGAEGLPCEEFPIALWASEDQAPRQLCLSFQTTQISSGFFLPVRNGVFDEILMKEALEERDFNSHETFSVSPTISKALIICLVECILQGPVRSIAFSFFELLKINCLHAHVSKY